MNKRYWFQHRYEDPERMDLLDWVMLVLMCAGAWAIAVGLVWVLLNAV